MTTQTAPCRACGTWECADCGWRRPLANRFSGSPHRCAKCGNDDGSMLPTRHRGSRADDHNDAFEKLMAGGRDPRYPLESRPANPQDGSPELRDVTLDRGASSPGGDAAVSSDDDLSL